jgi:predicted transcriptional regulator
MVFVDFTVNKRFEIGNKAVEKLEEISKELDNFDSLAKKTTQKRNNILRKLRNLFHEGTPKAEYSAVVASYLLHDDDYEIIKNLLLKNGLWDDEFIALEELLKFCALDVIA